MSTQVGTKLTDRCGKGRELYRLTYVAIRAPRYRSAQPDTLDL